MDNLPNHIAIICDGNRRWARARNLPTLIGHQKGLDAFKKVSKHLRDKGVHTITAWAFSTENWDRSEEEISYLMKLFGRFFDDNFKEVMEDEVKVIHLGRKDRLPKELLEKIADIEQKTKHFTKHVYNVALDYGGHDEITRAVQKMSATDIQNLSNMETAQNLFSSYLDTHNQPYPNPDMLIRTGGEQRLSGFLSWQIAYTELFFPKETLPDLTPEVVDNLLEEYANRNRRFGK